jgi:hypothetical protein
MSAGVVWLAGAVGLVGTVITAVFTGLVTKEAESWLDMVPGWLLRLARRQVPVSHREELYDEWAAELHYALHCCEDRPLTRLWLGVRYAAGLVRAGRQMVSGLGSARANLCLRPGEVIALSFLPSRPGFERIDLEDVVRDLSAGLAIRESGVPGRGHRYLMTGKRWQVVIVPRRGRESGSHIAHVVQIRPADQPYGTGMPVRPQPVAFHPIWKEKECDLPGLTQADSPPGDEK